MTITIQKTIYGWRADAATNGEASHPLYNAICALAGLLNAEAEAARDAKEAEEQAKFTRFLASHPTVFVRFGKVPADGISRNHRDGIAEPGTSCYEARQLADGSFYLLMNTTSLGTFVCGGFLGARPAYLLRGEVCGQGSDGEPCLKLEDTRRIRKGTRIIWCAGSFNAA